MIGIATIDYDEQGHITFDELPESNLNPPDARVTRTPTLSGGAVIHPATLIQIEFLIF